MPRTEYWSRKVALNAFRQHRKTWSPPAAYHLTRLSYGADWRDRLCSWLWLISNRIIGV